MININKVKTYSVKTRYSKVRAGDFAKIPAKGASFKAFYASLPDILKAVDLRAVVDAVVSARKKKKAVILMMGAHVIKCGLNPVVIELIKKKVITCICLNGAGIIHDFEIALQGKTSEDVAANLKDGKFGMGRETAAFLNQAVSSGVAQGLGLGYSVAKKISTSALPHKDLSLLYQAYKNKIPVCVFVAIGTDIIHQHPSFNAASAGEGSLRDFHKLTEHISGLNNAGVVLNFGSAVILPEVFLKALNLSRNLGHPVEDFTTANFDMLYHYRPSQNVVSRPTLCGGSGYYIIGHHEIMLPLLAQAILRKIMNNLKNIIRNFPGAKIMVIGDLILDEYIWGSVDRISPEAPVPVVWANKKTHAPGGAANVGNNIRALGGEVSLVGVTGQDKNGEVLLSELKKRNVNTKGIIKIAKRHTTVKTRIIAGHQQIVRIDWEHTDALTPKINNGILGFIEKNIRNFDALVIEDYGKGVVNAHLLSELAKLTRRYKKIITVDPKEENFLYYRGVTCITPNRKELENAIRNLKIKDTTNRFKLNNDRLVTDKDVDLAGRQILKYLKLDSMLVTLGEHGMQLFEKSGRITHIPTVAQEVFDVSGAGDTVISAFTLALCSGADKLEAAKIANFAAGIVVSKIGTAVTSRKELLEKIEQK